MYSVLRTLVMLLAVRRYNPESIERFIEDQAFSPSYGLAPTSPLFGQQAVFLYQSSSVSPAELTVVRVEQFWDIPYERLEDY
jgi:hypothetical protein